MKHRFSLTPFADNAPAVEIIGDIERQHNQLKIVYKLQRTPQIIIPEPANNPTRRYDLWEHTCCEFFLGLKNSTKYWEFNLAPSRHWNVFRFDNYRQDIAEEMAFNALPFQILRGADSLELNLAVDLERIISPKQDLEVGITTVIENKDRQLSYWALSHPAKEADFHLRDSFIIEL